MAAIRIVLALGDYDHTRDLSQGVVRAEGIDINHLNLPIEEITFRFLKFREWEASELSFAKYVALRSQGDDSIVALPVFPSRMFRLSSIYVGRGGKLRTPADLRAGARIGVPEWAQTAAIYTRGYIVHELGVPLAAVEWFQAGVNQPGRAEKVALDLPQGVRLQPVPDRSLNEMLLDGTLDAALSARPPAAFPDGGIVRLVPDYREAEEAYFRKTGVFPIMHVVVLRRDVLDAHPWVAMSLLKAFEAAKRRSLARLADITASHAPLPWTGDYVARVREQFGEDPFPYGIEPNRRTLDAFLEFAHEQGICRRRLEPEALFPPQVGAAYKI